RNFIGSRWRAGGGRSLRPRSGRCAYAYGETNEDCTSEPGTIRGRQNPGSPIALGWTSEDARSETELHRRVVASPARLHVHTGSFQSAEVRVSRAHSEPIPGHVATHVPPRAPL